MIITKYNDKLNLLQLNIMINHFFFTFQSLDMEPSVDSSFGLSINGNWTGIRGQLQRMVTHIVKIFSHTFKINIMVGCFVYIIYLISKLCIGSRFGVCSLFRFFGIRSIRARCVRCGWCIRTFRQISNVTYFNQWTHQSLFTLRKLIVHVLLALSFWFSTWYNYV